MSAGPRALLGESRTLGAVERSFAQLNAANWLTHVVVVRLRKPLPIEHLREAAARLPLRHATLGAQIVEEQGQWLIRAAPGAQVRVEEGALAAGDDPRWPAQAREALHRGFLPEEGLPWRLILVRTPPEDPAVTLVMAFHHAVEDGISSERVLRDLVEDCGALARGEALAPPSPSPLRAPVEVLTRATLTWRMKLWCALRAAGRALAPGLTWVERDSPVEGRRTVIRCHWLEEAHTAALQRRARAEGTTVHGALCAAMMLAAAARLPEGPLRLQCDASVNMRPLCQPPVEEGEVGMYISSVSWVYRLRRGDDLWGLAREVKRRTAECVERGDPVQHPLLLEWLRFDPAQARRAALEGGGRQQALFVSNLGRYPWPLPPPEAPAAPLELYYATGQHALGASLWLGAVTLGGRLCCTFASVSPLLAEETAATAAQDVMERLARAASA